MKISIITSLYNEVDNLPLLFDSISSQTFKDFEFLITDDGSTDGTGEKLRNYCSKGLNIRIFRQPNKGLTHSLNRMIKESKGRYIARMDAGDFSYPERLQRQAEYLDQNPDVAVVGCWTRFKYKQDPLLDFKFPNDHIFLKDMLARKTNCFSHGSIMFRKSVLNGISEPYRFPFGQDFDFLFRISLRGKMAMLEEILYEYQFSIDSLSFRRAAFQKQFAKLALQNYKKKSRHEIDRDIEKIMKNTKPLDSKTALGDFYIFIGNLLLRSCFPKEAKEYYIKSLKNGKRKCLPHICLCCLGRFGSKLTNFIGNRIYPGWKYKISCISAGFRVE